MSICRPLPSSPLLAHPPDSPRFPSAPNPSQRLTPRMGPAPAQVPTGVSGSQKYPSSVELECRCEESGERFVRTTREQEGDEEEVQARRCLCLSLSRSLLFAPHLCFPHRQSAVVTVVTLMPVSASGSQLKLVLHLSPAHATRIRNRTEPVQSGEYVDARFEVGAGGSIAGVDVLVGSG